MKARYAPRVWRDLECIRDYVAKESGSDTAANRLVAELLDACDTLVVMPERHGSYRYAPGWRMMPVGLYLVFFRISENEVRVGHVRHGSRSPFRG